MKKTKEELETLKDEYKKIMSKLNELDEEELNIVAGGFPVKERVYLSQGTKDKMLSGELLKGNLNNKPGGTSGPKGFLQ